MIAVDTNVLVYAHRRDHELHQKAVTVLRDLAEAVEPWALPWPCIHEFIAVTTHARVFSPPSTVDEALEQVAAWLASPSLVLLAERLNHWQHLRGLLEAGDARGGRVHDARIVALCLAHGVTELWSADRDFGRFPQIRVRNPLVG